MTPSAPDSALQGMLVDRETSTAAARCVALGVEPLLLKGPAIASWLYADDPGNRPYRDVDLLVPRERLGEVVAAVAAHGWVAPLGNAAAGEQDGHSVVLTPTTTPSCEIDVHFSLPGVRCAPERVWPLLWARRERLAVGGHDLWALDVVGRSVVVVLHAARNGGSNPQSTEDLRRLLARLPLGVWPDVVALATALQALPALVRGLDLLPEGRPVVEQFGLAGVTDVEMELRRADAPALAYGLAELRSLTAPARVRRVARELWPTTAFLRRWAATGSSQGAAGSHRPTAVLRAARARFLLTQLWPTVRAYARARRRAGRG